MSLDWKSLGEKLREARRGKAIKQAELAKLLSVTQSSISRVEGGKPDSLSKQKLDQLAKHLGVELKAEDLAPARGPEKAAGDAGKDAYCCWLWCPSCVMFRMAGRLHMMPTLQDVSEPDSRRFCDVCGEPLQVGCPRCGAARVGRVYCQHCGAVLVEVDPSMAEELLEAREECLSEAAAMRRAGAELAAWQRETLRHPRGTA